MTYNFRALAHQTTEVFVSKCNQDRIYLHLMIYFHHIFSNVKFQKNVLYASVMHDTICLHITNIT